MLLLIQNELVWTIHAKKHGLQREGIYTETRRELMHPPSFCHDRFTIIYTSPCLYPSLITSSSPSSPFCPPVFVRRYGSSAQLLVVPIGTRVPMSAFEALKHLQLLAQHDYRGHATTEPPPKLYTHAHIGVVERTYVNVFRQKLVRHFVLLEDVVINAGSCESRTEEEAEESAMTATI